MKIRIYLIFTSHGGVRFFIFGGEKLKEEKLQSKQALVDEIKDKKEKEVMEV